MDHVNEIPICFPGEYFAGNFLNVGHTDYQTHEFEQVKIYPFRILSEAILHLCWNIKLFPKTVKKIKYIPNFQGILNWKLQIIIVKCNTEKTKTVSLLNKMLLLVSAFLSVNCVSRFLPYSTAEFSGSWTQYFSAEILQIFNVMPEITFSSLKTTFSKWSQNITTCV